MNPTRSMFVTASSLFLTLWLILSIAGVYTP